MIKDKIFIGSMAGMIGSLAKDLPNYILYKLGIVHYLYAHLAASAHLVPESIKTPIGFLIGFTGDIITGGAIGVATINFLGWFGKDYWWYKGLIIGNTVWLFGLGVILNLGAVHLVPVDPVFRLTTLFDHLAYGLTTVFIICKWETHNEKAIMKSLCQEHK